MVIRSATTQARNEHMNASNTSETFAGAMTLLQDCIGGQSGERLLIVSEPEGCGFYNDDAPKLTAAAARALGMRVYRTEAEALLQNATDTESLYDTLRGFTHVVFFSRVGDQIRFLDHQDMPSMTMCYTLDLESLKSDFGTACYHGMCEVKAAIDEAFMSASHIKVTCPRGTDYSGRPAQGDKTPTEVTLKRYPMLVSQPIPALGFSGRVALSRFLVGTGSCPYEPYCLPLQEDVFACIEDNRITRFEGKPSEVERINNHYRHVSALLSVEPWYVDSWHAGIHPGCQFSNDAQEDILRWSSSAFGNPRLLHFHTCGEYAPGEISWNIVDPSIELDSVPVWESGYLYPERLPNGDRIFENHPKLEMLFQNPYREIGLSA